jgi:hypothetical protein
MSFRSASRDYPDIVSALRVGNVQHLAPIQPEQADPLLAIILALVYPFDRKRILASDDRLLEAHAVIDEVARSLVRIPLEADHKDIGYH